MATVVVFDLRPKYSFPVVRFRQEVRTVAAMSALFYADQESVHENSCYPPQSISGVDGPRYTKFSYIITKKSMIMPDIVIQIRLGPEVIDF